MAREQVLHMNGGVGETSYANNSLQQRKVISEVRPILEERVTKLYSTIFPDCLKVGDLGCSSGPNALLVASEIVDIIHTKACRLNLEPPTFQIFLNDLPGNDFNTVFKLLPDFYTRLEEEKGSEFGTCSIAGLPGSFYGRLFPPNSMHFFHSSYSIHWLSQPPKGLAGGEVVPLNKENIYFTKRSQPEVYNAYFEQFQQDFELFLRLRSKELVPFGGMVLTFLGRIENNEFVTPWELIGEALNDMVSKGFIDEGKLETFNMPYYGATIKEVKKGD
ncbi:Methyltransferase-like protein [Quillaja saponaria]|uniref:Methyltransferase-like protein n=1 Tax=Quillaja saponaria TaxID=32244 RepID=A0AAD7LZR5_QUISA|nr:Methyltransferase-like protein [Quillaja saponaria]